MTNREFFTLVSNGTINDDVKAHADEQLQKLDARNASRSSKPTKTQIENEPVKDAIHAVLVNAADGMTAPDIATAMTEAGTEITTQKVSALCRQMVEEGRLTAEEVKVPKKGKMKKYSAMQVVDAETAE